MDLIETIIIAIVEGLTEFLPVSSTGHMIIAQNLLGVPSTPFVKAFTVIIQFGAILSVVLLYWKRFFQLNHTPAPEGSTSLQKFLHKWDFYWKIFVAFVPAVVLGGLLNGVIEHLLGSVTIVAIMLVVGGVFMLFCDKWFCHGKETNPVTEKRAFFLAVPTMLAATCLEVLKMILAGEFDDMSGNISTLLIGSLVSFVVAILAMKWFVSFIAKYGFKLFGWYRIIVGLLILGLLLTGHSLQMVD